MTISFTLMILLAFCTGSLAAYLAYKRGRNLYIWFAVGFFFGLLGAMTIFFAPKRNKGTPSEPPKSQPVESPIIQGPSGKFWYYVDRANQQTGPMSLDALTAAWKEGKIFLTTYVWHEELPDWKPLQDLLKG